MCTGTEHILKLQPQFLVNKFYSIAFRNLEDGRLSQSKIYNVDGKVALKMEEFVPPKRR